MDRQVGVEQVGETDSERFRCQPEQIGVGIEGPALARRLNLQASLVGAVKDLLLRLPRGCAVSQGARLRPVPLELDDIHSLVGNYAANSGARYKRFEG